MHNRLWAQTALLADGWHDAVAIDIDAHGNIESVARGAPRGGETAEVLVPAIANLHSHAHQRAMAGLGERAGASGDAARDSFWTWRKIMYHYLERIGPDDLGKIAAQLYVEMLKAGYACVGEFQYLHHDLDGRAYANPAEMTLQCAQAARDTGIGFTALPVLYRYGGFGSAAPVDGQKRFLNDADAFCEIVTHLQDALHDDPDATVGIAPHSLRAIDEALLGDVLASLDGLAAIHLHVAEQIGEVDDCVTWSGQRPVAWLFDRFAVDARWCLIHATHMDADETLRMAQSGCVAGLCPTTEANLGDGLFNALAYSAADGAWGIGSDSHISIDPVEELRWLEYGMRLQQRQRNLLCSPDRPNTGRWLLDGALAGGARACGRDSGRIEAGCRADFITLDASHPRLYRRSGDDLVDSWIFSGNERLVRDVWVGGKKVIADGRHADEERIARDYRDTLDRLAE